MPLHSEIKMFIIFSSYYFEFIYVCCDLNVPNGAILSGFPTTGYAGYRIRTEEGPKVHDLSIQGRISEDHAKTLTRA